MNCTKMEVDKKKRGQNFVSHDVMLLVKLVERNKDVIEDKEPHKTSNSEKQLCWHNMAAEYNTHCHVHRTIPELRSKWINLKKTVRKKLKHNRKERMKPAGEQMEIHHLNPEEVIAKNIMKIAAPMLYPYQQTPCVQPPEETSRGSIGYLSENDKSEMEAPENYEFSSFSVKQEMQIEDTEINIQSKNDETNLYEFVRSELRPELPSEVQATRSNSEVQQSSIVENKTPSKRKYVDDEADMRKEILQLEAEYIKLKIDRRRERYMQKVRREEEQHLKKLAVLEAKAEYYKRKMLRNKK